MDDQQRRARKIRLLIRSAKKSDVACLNDLPQVSCWPVCKIVFTSIGLSVGWFVSRITHKSDFHETWWKDGLFWHHHHFLKHKMCFQTLSGKSGVDIFRRVCLSHVTYAAGDCPRRKRCTPTGTFLELGRASRRPEL